MKPLAPYRRRRAGRAFFLMDLMIALAMATALLLSLSIAVGSLHRAQRQMADARAAARHLELSLLSLQAGGKMDPDLQLERLPGGVADRVWVRLSPRPGAATDRQPRASLVGLVPANQAPGGAP